MNARILSLRLAQALVLGMLCATVQAAEPSAAKKELIAKVLKLQQPAIEQVARGLVEQPAARLIQQSAMAMQTRVPSDKREALGKAIQAEIKKYADGSIPLVRERAVALAPSTVGALLDAKFTDDELKQLVAILESPVNKKFQQLGGEMHKVLAEKVIAESKDAVQPKVKALEQAVTKLVTDASATTSAAKPAVAPAK